MRRSRVHFVVWSEEEESEVRPHFSLQLLRQGSPKGGAGLLASAPWELMTGNEGQHKVVPREVPVGHKE